MVKAERHGEDVQVEVRGNKETLLNEYGAVLRSLYHFMKDGIIKETELAAPESLMYAMVEKVIKEERQADGTTREKNQ